MANTACEFPQLLTMLILWHSLTLSARLPESPAGGEPTVSFFLGGMALCRVAADLSKPDGSTLAGPWRLALVRTQCPCENHACSCEALLLLIHLCHAPAVLVLAVSFPVPPRPLVQPATANDDPLPLPPLWTG